MAESDANLVSEIQITGSEKAQSDLNALGAAGASSFDRMVAAAKSASSSIGSSVDNIVAKMAGIDKSVPSSVPGRLSQIEAASRSVGTAVANTAIQVSKFGLGISALGIGAVGAVAGFAKFAASATAAARAFTGNKIDEALEVQKKLNKQAVTNTGTLVGYQVEVDKLGRQFRNGELDANAYAKALRDLEQNYKDQQRVAQAVQTAQEETLRLNQKLEVQAAQKNAYESLVKVYGRDLTAALMTLGRSYDQVHKQIVNAFSPALGQLVNRITDVIDRNRGVISDFVNTTSKSLLNYINNNGAAIDRMIEFVSKLAKGVVDVIKNLIVPGITYMMGFLDTIAAGINKVFGTDINSGFLLVVAAVLKFTGTMGPAVSLITTLGSMIVSVVAMMGPWAIVIALVAAALVLLYRSVNWSQLATDAVAAGNSIITFFTNIPTMIGNLFATAWSTVSNLASTAAQLVASLWTSAWNTITSGAQAVADYIVGAWNNVVAFFQGLPAQVGDIFTNIGLAIQGAFDNAVAYVSGLIKQMVNNMLSWVQPLIDSLKKIPGLAAEAASSTAGAQSNAEGGLIRGAGTGTSDSILSWLSNSEFVVRARSVAKYGTGLLHAINNGTFRMPRFAMGGLVSMPALPTVSFGGSDDGSSSGTRSILNLTIDGQQFNGLMVPESIGDRLTKYAIARQTRSAGRKPGWVGGSN